MDDNTTIIGTKITMLLRREACLPIPNAVLMLVEPQAKRLQLTLILTLHQRSDAPKGERRIFVDSKHGRMVRPLDTLGADITGGIALGSFGSVYIEQNSY